MIFRLSRRSDFLNFPIKIIYPGKGKKQVFPGHISKVSSNYFANCQSANIKMQTIWVLFSMTVFVILFDENFKSHSH